MQNTTNTTTKSKSAQKLPYQSYSADALHIAKLCGCEIQAIQYLSANRTHDEIMGFISGMCAMHDSLQACTFEELIALPVSTSKLAA